MPTKAQKRAKARAEMMKRREAGFDTNTANDKLPKYNALFDSNLRHFFENRNVQTHLYKTGLIDRGGRIIDLDRNKAKLAIIEQEFTNAQKEEEARLREEEEMRRRVQKKRHEALEKARRQEKMLKMKEDRRIQKEIVKVQRGEHAITKPKPRRRRRKKRSPGASLESGGSSGDVAFFMTSVDDEGGADGGGGDASELIDGGAGGGAGAGAGVIEY